MEARGVGLFAAGAVSARGRAGGRSCLALLIASARAALAAGSIPAASAALAGAASFPAAAGSCFPGAAGAVASRLRASGGFFGFFLEAMMQPQLQVTSD
jgi:hypothetical protein